MGLVLLMFIYSLSKATVHIFQERQSSYFTFYYCCSRDSSVGIVTKLWGERTTNVSSRLALSRPESLLFLPSSSSIVLKRLSGPRSGPTTFQKIW
jgi:hypothetical protein